MEFGNLQKDELWYERATDAEFFAYCTRITGKLLCTETPYNQFIVAQASFLQIVAVIHNCQCLQVRKGDLIPFEQENYITRPSTDHMQALCKAFALCKDKRNIRNLAIIVQNEVTEILGLIHQTINGEAQAPQNNIIGGLQP